MAKLRPVVRRGMQVLSFDRNGKVYDIRAQIYAGSIEKILRRSWFVEQVTETLRDGGKIEIAIKDLEFWE